MTCLNLHKMFNTLKLGSPVRVFATFNLGDVKLPEDYYKFCSTCSIWVAKSNSHCIKCNECTSKNGGVYWHCKICQRCVKQSWKHCKRCKKCTLANHHCMGCSWPKQLFQVEVRIFWLSRNEYSLDLKLTVSPLWYIDIF